MMNSQNLLLAKMKTAFELPSIPNLARKIDLFTEGQAYDETVCLIAANNDLQAVRSWLQQYRHKNTTFLTYKREADRLLLWCSYEIGKTLGQLQVEDFTKYLEFLSNPPKEWCTDVGKLRYGGTRWRPFLKGLSDSAKGTAIRVVNSLMNYLVDAGYLRANPLRLIKQYRKFSIKTEDYKYSVWAKILDQNEWQALQQTLQELPSSTPFERDNKLRLQLIFACMYVFIRA